MKTVYAVFGTLKNDPEYMEQLLAEIPDNSKTEQNIRHITELATSEGFDRIRVIKNSGEMPDFSDPKLLNI